MEQDHRIMGKNLQSWASFSSMTQQPSQSQEQNRWTPGIIQGWAEPKWIGVQGNRSAEERGIQMTPQRFRLGKKEAR